MTFRGGLKSSMPSLQLGNKHERDKETPEVFKVFKRKFEDWKSQPTHEISLVISIY